jgi:hypothetical protein
VRAYATNKAGTSYGNEIPFTTLPPTTPTLSATSAISNITQISATSGGTITSDGGAAVTARGVCWSTTPNPTTSNNKTTDGSGIASFTSNLSSLTAGTTYYVRAYATNSAGTGYGIAVQFSTTGADLPILTTNAVTSITTNSAGCGGNVTSDGGSAVTSKGVCWSTISNPTISNNKTTDGSGTGTFISSLTSLARGTKYYIRAFATNSVGTAYGNEVTFTTNVIIGDAFQGGKVFYILQASDYGYNANVQHGLICATADQSTFSGIKWTITTAFVNNTVTTIGYGDINSIYITLNQGAGTSYAAGLARAHNGGVYTDWFLPSLNELNQLYINRIATATSFSTALYWSSSETSSTSARALDFSNGSNLTTGYLKTNTYRVRAIRKF